MRRVGGSFRDPSGYVFDDGVKIVRTINEQYKPIWEYAEACGLFSGLNDDELLVPFESADIPRDMSGKVWKCVEPERIPFISYPYEWSFSQLKDAALLTLDVLREALARGMTLKDASAYNVQFKGAHPLFIDLLSFDIYKEGDIWQGYRQFCMHFLAPLALMKYNIGLGGLSRQWIDGVPLSLASSLLPRRSQLSLGLQMHVHTHARAEQKFSDGRKAGDKVRTTSLSKNSLTAIVESLESCVRSLRLPGIKTEWTDYYTDTNYTEEADAFKLHTVSRVAGELSALGERKTAIDLGANNGKFSAALAEHYDCVIAADIDPLAVDEHYRTLQAKKKRNILPLVMDLANPSPALGWAERERFSFKERCRADLVTALALVHHLRLTCGVPFLDQAAWFAEIIKPGGHLLVEFVNREDSQVKRLLAARDDTFEDFDLNSFAGAFSGFFVEESRIVLPESKRVLLALKRCG